VQQASSLLFPCANGIDDDGDGLADFPLDPGCADTADGSERDASVACDNNLDDDGDGLIDLADPGCDSPGDTSERTGGVCDNGVDDDGDASADFPDDPGCGSVYGTREDPECQDGADNDGDGRIDFDGGQAIHGLCVAGICPPGVSDPDGDGIADADAYCAGFPQGTREQPVFSCGLGAELALLLPLLMALRRRATRGIGALRSDTTDF